MNKLNLMDRVLHALSVPKCTCCKKRLSYEEKALCLDCSAVFEDFKTRNCAFCSRILNECDCSVDFLRKHYIKRVVKCFRYLGYEEAAPGNSLIYSLKRDNRSDVLFVCTKELKQAIINSVEKPEECIFTNVPRRKAAVIKYGIDHSQLLAKSLAKEFNARYVSLLGSRAKTEQKSLDTEERFKNANFYITRNMKLEGKRVIIVDDIITSGASMGMAASLIRSLGCRDIVAATLAIAYKDK